MAGDTRGGGTRGWLRALFDRYASRTRPHYAHRERGPTRELQTLWEDRVLENHDPARVRRLSLGLLATSLLSLLLALEGSRNAPVFLALWVVTTSGLVRLRLAARRSRRSR